MQDSYHNNRNNGTQKHYNVKYKPSNYDVRNNFQNVEQINCNSFVSNFYVPPASFPFPPPHSFVPPVRFEYKHNHQHQGPVPNKILHEGLPKNWPSCHPEEFDRRNHAMDHRIVQNGGFRNTGVYQDCQNFHPQKRKFAESSENEMTACKKPALEFDVIPRDCQQANLNELPLTPPASISPNGINVEELIKNLIKHGLIKPSNNQKEENLDGQSQSLSPKSSNGPDETNAELMKNQKCGDDIKSKWMSYKEQNGSKLIQKSGLLRTIVNQYSLGITSKRLDPRIKNNLSKGQQCQTCGMRFREDSPFHLNGYRQNTPALSRLRSHLDDHFKLSSGVGVKFQRYLRLRDWINLNNQQILSGSDKASKSSGAFACGKDSVKENGKKFIIDNCEHDDDEDKSNEEDDENSEELYDMIIKMKCNK